MLRRRPPDASPFNVLTLAMGAILAGVGDADAMDCSRASTPAERAICGNKKLLFLDRDLTIVYHKFIKVFSDTGHYTHLVAATRTGQKEWLRERNACGSDAACIKAAYEKRLALLQSHVCYPRDDSPIYEQSTPTPKPAPQTQPRETASACSPTDRVDYDFIKKSEGAMLDFYVPGAFKANVKTGRNLGPNYKKNAKTGKLEQKATDASGVTVGEGVDLGQQTVANLWRYMHIEAQKYGNPEKVDIQGILNRAQPFIGKKKSTAVNALNDYYDHNDKRYPKLARAEADFISSAVKHGYAEDAAVLFNKNAHPKMNFWALPSAVQTTLTDMKYHSYIPSIAQRYYRADWEGAADEFEKLSSGKYFKYQSRFQARAQMLRDAIKDQSLPKQGDPCAPQKMPVAFNRSIWWESQRRPRWA